MNPFMIKLEKFDLNVQLLYMYTDSFFSDTNKDPYEIIKVNIDAFDYF